MLPIIAPSPDIIAGFYEAAARRQGWSDAWSALCSAFDAETGLLYRRSRPAAQPVILAACNWPAQAHGLPRDSGLQLESSRPAARRPIDISPGHDPAWFEAAGADQPASPAHARRNIPSDRLCATAPLEGTAVISMGLHRPASAPRFTEADRHALDGMGRHVAAAMRLEALLAAERITSAVRGAAMDVSRHGIVVLSATGTILFANAAARAIAGAQGVVLGAWASGMDRINPHEAAKLEALVTSVGGGGPGGCVRLTRRDGRAPLAATVDPLPAPVAEQNGLPDGHYVLITLRDLGATTDAAPSQLMDLFGLTAAEAGIVPQLLCGESASLIAQSRGVAVSTVKAQSGKVLAKTGAANLRALSMMIAALGCG